jgi:hypothetical protein
MFRAPLQTDVIGHSVPENWGKSTTGTSRRPTKSSKLLQALLERREASFTVWVVRGPVHEHANAPDRFAPLRAPPAAMRQEL